MRDHGRENKTGDLARQWLELSQTWAQLQLIVTHTQDKVDHNGSQQGNREDSWSEAVIETALPPPPDTLCAPVERYHGVDHSRHGDNREQCGGDTTDTITEVEETHGQTAEDDGEVQP